MLFFSNGNIGAQADTIPLFGVTADIEEKDLKKGVEIIKFGSKGFEKNFFWFWLLFERLAGKALGDLTEEKSLRLISQAGFKPEGNLQEFMAEFRKNFGDKKVPDIFEIRTKFFNKDSAFMQYFCRYVANAQALDCVYNGVGSFSLDGRIINPLEVAPDAYARFYMSCPNGQSVRNRYRLVSRQVQEAGGGKFLSVACGSAQAMIHGVYELLREGKEASLLLSDADQNSLDMASKKVAQAGINDHVSYLKSKFFTLRNKLKGQNFDCVEMCGIFDYLTDEHVTWLSEFALSVLNPGGKVIVSNMTDAWGASNILRRMYNWEIITRSFEELGQLMRQAGGRNIKILEEPWGIFPVAVFSN